MANTQQFFGEGNLGNTPMLRCVGDVDVANFSVRFPVARKVKVDDGQGGERFEDTKGFWAEVSVWGWQAKKCVELLQKGSRVVVQGEMFLDQFTKTQGENAGETSHTLKVRADTIAVGLLGLSEALFDRGGQQKNPPDNQEAVQERSPQADDSAAVKSKS